VLNSDELPLSSQTCFLLFIEKENDKGDQNSQQRKDVVVVVFVVVFVERRTVMFGCRVFLVVM
jgi:hypothetical protein